MGEGEEPATRRAVKEGPGKHPGPFSLSKTSYLLLVEPVRSFRFRVLGCPKYTGSVYIGTFVPIQITLDLDCVEQGQHLH